MTRAQRLHRNPRLLFWAKTLVNFKTLNALITLFYLHRGLGLEQVVWLSGVFGVVTLVAEVPSGYLADRLGRKWTMLLGVTCLIGSSLVHLFAYGFPAFVVAFILMAFAGSCVSGTEEALLYDTLKEQKREGEMLRQNSRLLSAQNLPKIFLPAIGVLIAQGLTDAQFRILIGIDLAGALAALVLLALITEPRHKKSVVAYEKGIFRESIETIRSQPMLFIAALNKAIPLVASILVWRVYQPYLLDRGLPVLWLGLFYVIIHSAMFSLKWLAERIETRFGSSRVLDATAALMTLFIGAAAFLSSPALLFIAIGLYFIAHNIREPMFAHWINGHIPSRSRATTLSNLNVLRGVLDIPIMWAGGLLAAVDVRLAFVLAAALSLSVLVFFRVNGQDGDDTYV